MNLSSFDNTSLPSESPDSRLRRETTTEHTNNNATSIPDASVVTIGSAVSIKEDEKNFSSKLNKVGTNLKSFVGFIGPGYIIAIGYLDPGNWATDLSGGSQFGYSLLFIVFLSNLMAMLLQALAIKLGVVTGLDLAQACRTFLPKGLNYVLYVLCELAIIACDLAEVIGSAIALNLLFNIPLPAGVAITACDILLLLFIYRNNDIKAANIFEIMLMLLVGVVGFCFVVELVYSKPNSTDVLKGYLPSPEIFTNGEELYIAIGIIGATVMPHNLYLHSHLVQVRKNREESKGFDDKQLESAESQKSKIKSIVDNTLKLSIADSSVALLFALFVNSAILIVSGANFFYNSPNNQKPADLFDAYDLLTSYLGKAAATIFATALLIAGQSATITATMAGQVVMEGFCEWKLKPWVRRLITRGFAVIPAMIIAIVRGRNGLNDLLVASQVALSIQLPFAVIPMVWFTSQKKFMQVNTKDLEERVMADKLIRQNKSSTQPDLNSLISVTSSTPALTHSQTPDVSVSNEIYTSKPYDNHDKDNDILDFTNSITLTIISVIVSIVILGLDMYLVVTTIKG
ncbi:natural resistance-associated macrophage protein [Gigaspora margarita]|uniref:Natural resistance-associated macrophage protein n=1 Tax=Gigaspora margarita TaxID=4874 RepID=A0A8H3X353_GIGMA|nr:natural resistance-associated macrophage protein [Gigaspora margarita]